MQIIMESPGKHVGFLLLILSILSCSDNVNVYHFDNNKAISHLDGSPIDSFSNYIPKFGDSIGSYMYFKLNEPILFNYFLNKDIYRLTIHRPFDVPIVIRVENDGKKIKLISKRLNKDIWYPFYICGRDWSSPHYFPADVAELNEDGEVAKVLDEKAYNELLHAYKHYDDSLAKVHNDPDYKIIIDEETYLDKSVWDSITYLVEKSSFWTSGYNSFVNYPDPDASLWIIEGHSRFGYQCIRIYSPFSPEFGSGFENKSEKNKIVRQNKIKSKYARFLR